MLKLLPKLVVIISVTQDYETKSLPYLCTGDAKLQKKAVNFYKILFCCTYPVDNSAMDGVDVPKLLQRGVADLLKPVTKDEVYVALLSMDSLKSPGMMASNFLFFQDLDFVSKHR